MTSKFEVRRGLLLGVFGSGVAAMLAGCASDYREPMVMDEPIPERVVRPAPEHHRVVYRRKKVPVEARPGPSPSESNSTPSTVILPVGGGHSGGGGGNSGGGGWSDRRLKTGIHVIGQSASGLSIYQFRYIWGGPAFVGVMAQDLLETHPEAVILTESGYYMVDYDRIDVKMMTLAEYKTSVLRVAV
jgi:hypothetical protein